MFNRFLRKQPMHNSLKIGKLNKLPPLPKILYWYATGLTLSNFLSRNVRLICRRGKYINTIQVQLFCLRLFLNQTNGNLNNDFVNQNFETNRYFAKTLSIDK